MQEYGTWAVDGAGKGKSASATASATAGGWPLHPPERKRGWQPVGRGIGGYRASMEDGRREAAVARTAIGSVLKRGHRRFGFVLKGGERRGVVRGGEGGSLINRC